MLLETKSLLQILNLNYAYGSVLSDGCLECGGGELSESFKDEIFNFENMMMKCDLLNADTDSLMNA